MINNSITNGDVMAKVAIGSVVGVGLVYIAYNAFSHISNNNAKEKNGKGNEKEKAINVNGM